MRCALRIVAIATVALIGTLFGEEQRPSLLSRPDPRIDDDGGYIFDIPRAVDEHSAVREVAAALPTIPREGYALIILCPDRGLAARITREAFSLRPSNSMRGLDVQCLVGPRYDPYIRPSVTRTGAKLTTTRSWSMPHNLNSKGQRIYHRGQADARRDIARNRLVLRGSFPSRVFQKLLREKYNVEEPIIHPYEISMEDWAYDAGYNSISMREMERRFGEDFTERALVESRKKAFATRRPNQAMQRTAACPYA